MNSYIGSGPDCSSKNYNQEPPDDPMEGSPRDTYASFPPLFREPSPMTRLVKVEDGVVPNVTDITPDIRMLTPTPTTEDLVRRLDDGWTELKED